MKQKIAKMNNGGSSGHDNNKDDQIDSGPAFSKRSNTLREESNNDAFLDSLLERRKADLIVPASTKLGQTASKIFNNLIPTTLYE